MGRLPWRRDGQRILRRGKLSGESRQNVQVTDALVPLSEMFGYATDLRKPYAGTRNLCGDLRYRSARSIAESVVGRKNTNCNAVIPPFESAEPSQK